jgi:RHS repeat-associated protein
MDRGYSRANTLVFTGHERDYNSGTATPNTDYLDYMHARYYKASWGRFVSVDPTWISADLGRPQSWNRYSYVLNDPVNLIDPDGEAWDDIFKSEWWRKKFDVWFPPKEVEEDDPNREAVRDAGWTDEQAERMANPAGAAQRGLNEAGGTLAAEGTKQATVHVATIGGPVLLRAALARFNAKFTNVGRALTKHPEVVGLSKSTLRTKLRTEAAINRAAADALKNILRNGVRTTVSTPRFGEVIQVQIPGGFGARWYADGRFIGFINP